MTIFIAVVSFLSGLFWGIMIMALLIANEVKDE